MSDITWVYLEKKPPKVFLKKVLLKFAKFAESTCVSVLFSIKLQTLPATLLKNIFDIGLNVRPLTDEVLIVSHIFWTQGKQTRKATIYYSTFYNYIFFLIYNYSLNFSTKFYNYILFHWRIIKIRMHILRSSS